MAFFNTLEYNSRNVLFVRMSNYVFFKVHFKSVYFNVLSSFKAHLF